MRRLMPQNSAERELVFMIHEARRRFNAFGDLQPGLLVISDERIHEPIFDLKDLDYLQKWRDHMKKNPLRRGIYRVK
jgi:hypothetical protein